MIRRLRRVRRAYRVHVEYEDGAPPADKVCRFPSKMWLATTILLLSSEKTVKEVLGKL